MVQHFADRPVKIGRDVLSLIEFVIFCFGFENCLFSGNFSFIGQDVIAPEGKTFDTAGGEFLHGEGIFPLYQIFDIIKGS